MFVILLFLPLGRNVEDCYTNIWLLFYSEVEEMKIEASELWEKMKIEEVNKSREGKKNKLLFWLKVIFSMIFWTCLSF